MAVSTRTVDYTDGSVNLEGFFAFNESSSKPAPGLLIAHAWGGLDEFVCEKARKLADLGYAAFALDMYGKGVSGANVEENAALMQPFMENRPMLQGRMNAALQAILDLPEVDSNRIGAMGFCFGGLCVLDLARSGANIRAAVSFHGLLAAPGNAQGNAIKAKLLVLHGKDDPMVAEADISALQRELTHAGADWQFHIYGNAMHAFTNPVANDPGIGTVYHEAFDRRSWQSLLNFLQEALD